MPELSTAKIFCLTRDFHIFNYWRPHLVDEGVLLVKHPHKENESHVVNVKYEYIRPFHLDQIRGHLPELCRYLRMYKYDEAPFYEHIMDAVSVLNIEEIEPKFLLDNKDLLRRWS